MIEKGQSLIEVVIALGIVVILAVALVSTTVFTQKAARSAKNNTQATKLAQQTVEQLRVLRDRKGFDALTNGSCVVLDSRSSNPGDWDIKLPSSPGDCPQVVPDNTDFSRAIKITLDSANPKKKFISVEVSWQEPGERQSVSNNTFLVDICQDIIVPGAPCP